jgi:hypothetical protein
MTIAATTISCPPICFALRYRDVDGAAPHRQGAGGRGGSAERQLLRFDCFDNRPHYHYDPENRNVRIMLDPRPPAIRSAGR